MAFTPHSTVYLLGTPLDNKNKNQIKFGTQTEQYDYFFSCMKKTFYNMTYQRKDNVIKIPAHIDTLWNCNYVMYQNADFTHKWFYAFITKMEFVNEHTTDVYIETDVYQTWLFDVEIGESFVVREHVADDTIGLHLVDEQLEIGEYKAQTQGNVNKLGHNWNILAVSDNSPLGVTAPVGNIYGNVVTGLTYFPFPNTTQGINWLKDTIQTFTSAGKADAIVMIFTVPELIIPFVNTVDYVLGEPIHSGEPYGFDLFTLMSKPLSNVDGYVPKNKKLHTYPYKYLYVSNNSGQSAVYKYENFSNNDLEFYIAGSVSPNPSVVLVPSNYLGEFNYENGLMLSGFPLCSWTSDAFTAWFAQNGASAGVGLVGSLAGIVGGVVSANPLAIAGGALGVFGELAQINKALIQPDQARGHVGGGTLLFGTNNLDYTYYTMNIKSSYAKRIDDYFTMFGYKVNALKVPELHSRKYWNYVQTIDVNITGSIPDEDMRQLKLLYDSGITLWHYTNHFLDYSLSNIIL